MGKNYSIALCDPQELVFLFLSGGSFLSLGLFSVGNARSALSQSRVDPSADIWCSAYGRLPPLWHSVHKRFSIPSGNPRSLTQWYFQALFGFCLQPVSCCDSRTYLHCYPSPRKYNPILPIIQHMKTGFSGCLRKRGKSGLCCSVFNESKIILRSLNFNNFIVTSNFLALLYPNSA